MKTKFRMFVTLKYEKSHLLRRGVNLVDDALSLRVVPAEHVAPHESRVLQQSRREVHGELLPVIHKFSRSGVRVAQSYVCNALRHLCVSELSVAKLSVATRSIPDAETTHNLLFCIVQGHTLATMPPTS